MKRIRNILIVCTGNTARSPVGKYIGEFYAKKYGADLFFDSAGFLNAFSYMQPESRKFLDSKGINHLNFNPKIINRSLLERQDLILTMEQSHKEDIIKNFNNLANIEKKIFTLKEFNGDWDNLDIIDPYYTSRDTYEKVLKIIDQNMEKAVKRIIELNKS